MEMFCKNFAKITERHLCQSLFFSKVEGVLSCEFCEIFMNTFIYRISLMAASVLLILIHDGFVTGCNYYTGATLSFEDKVVHKT